MQLEAIQQALREQSLDGWLFFDHHERDPLAYRILTFRPPRLCTRRWYYLIPSHGEPRGLVHAIERHNLDGLPGVKRPYAGRDRLVDGLRELLHGVKRALSLPRFGLPGKAGPASPSLRPGIGRQPLRGPRPRRFEPKRSFARLTFRLGGWI